MSTICITVHDLRALLGAPEEEHSCHEQYLAELVEEKTVDHWSAHYQLEPSPLDLNHMQDDYGSLETDLTQSSSGKGAAK